MKKKDSIQHRGGSTSAGNKSRASGRYYVQNKGYVGNCLLWWREAGCGYTCNLDEAGIFTRSEAESICKDRPTEDIAWPVRLVRKHAHLHVGESLLRVEPRQKS
jgi:hypothetical protein